MTDRDPEAEITTLLPEADEQELAEALRAAYDPAPIGADRHAELLAAALEDPFAPASAEELAESERLRQALEQGDDTHAGAALARALRAAVHPGSMPDPSRAAETAKSHTRGRGSVVYASFGALALAAAAAFGVLVTRPEPRESASAVGAAPLPAFAQSRSTGTLFEEPFEARAATSRIDRIAASRARDLRENRYLAWGVR